MSILTNGMKIGNAIVTVDILPDQNKKIRPGKAMQPKFVTYHNTGSPGKGGDAKAHNSYIHRLANSDPATVTAKSWHFTVDDGAIYQHIPLNENAYHCGDGVGPTAGNMTSIGIEICMHSDQKDYHQAEENAIALGAMLGRMFKMPEENHVPHQKWSGKYCPSVILSRDGGFEKFHARIKAALKNGVAVETKPKEPIVVIEPTGAIIGTAEILVSVLNVRADASFSSAVVGVAKKGQKFDVYETKNGLHHTKTGWFSAGESYSKFTKKVVEVPAEKTPIGTAEILVNLLNVRATADFEGSVVDVVQKGQKYNVYETSNGLHRIGKDRWISAGATYVRFVSAAVAPKGDMKTMSIVTYLNSIGMNSSFDNRKKLAAKYGIANYAGTAAQNTKLLEKMRG